MKKISMNNVYIKLGHNSTHIQNRKIQKNVTDMGGGGADKNAIKPFNPLKIQSVPRSKHTPSRSLKPLKVVHGNNRCFVYDIHRAMYRDRILFKPGGRQ